MKPPPAPLAHRLFHLVGRLRAGWMLRGFERAARDAPAVNAATLDRIVRANADCAFGRQHGFAALSRDRAAWSRAVPLQRWADVEPWVDRMARGEPGVLCTAPVLFFALSSGTTGASKRIPATAASFAWQRKYYTGINPAVPASQLAGGFDPHPGITILSAAGATQRTEGGLPIALASANGLSRVRRIVPYLWTSPWPVFEVPDLETSWYLHARYGLQSPTAKFLSAVFAPQLLAWLGFVEEHWEWLVRDVAEGRVSAPLPEATRAAVLPRLWPDPVRAAELDRAVAGGFAGFARRVWPWMRYASAVITGPFAGALPRLRHYLGDLPIHTTVWSASEGMLGLNLEIDQPERYVLCNGCVHFEFIPVEHADEDQPATVGLEELQPGRPYEVVISNEAGLYRYRLGDVVEVVGRHHASPVVAFRYRLGSVVDLVGEKTTEDQVMSALRRALPGREIVDFAVWPELGEPPRYAVYVEFGGEPAGDRALDDALSVENVLYGMYRGRRLGAAVLRRLRAGSLAELERWRLERNPGVGHNQLKTPHLLKDEGMRGFLEGRVE